MNGLIIVWLIISMLFLIAELGSPGFFFFFSFFIGALIAAVSAMFISTLMIQLFIFLGGIITAFLCMQAWIRVRSPKLDKKQETNIDELIGKVAIVVKPVCGKNNGYIRFQGVLWMAFSLHNDIIPEGRLIEIVDVKGSHLIVK